jgi:steroid delta-isomerase-like uncharacterized protein
MSTPAQTPADTVARFLGALADHDTDAAIALTAPDVAVDVHPLHVAGTGQAVLGQVLTDLVRAFPDLLITVGRVIATGDVVTALFKAEGTQAADYAGAINQEKHLDIDQAWRFTVTGGRITQVHAYWCQAQLYRRLAVKRFDEIAIA